MFLDIVHLNYVQILQNVELSTIKNYRFNLSLYLSIAYTNELCLNLSVLQKKL